MSFAIVVRQVLLSLLLSCTFTLCTQRFINITHPLGLILRTISCRTFLEQILILITI